jgi:hypothetical protein
MKSVTVVVDLGTRIKPSSPFARRTELLRLRGLRPEPDATRPHTHGPPSSARAIGASSAKKYAGQQYVAATVYELAPREDGVLVYRRSGEQAEPRRSERLALKDAEEIAARSDIPLWAHVKHNMTVLDAVRGVNDGDGPNEITPASAYRLTPAEELLAEMRLCPSKRRHMASRR